MFSHFYFSVDTRKSNGSWKFDNSHVSRQSVWVPIGVDGVSSCPLGELAGLICGLIVGAKSECEKSGTIGAVSSSQDVGRVDQGTTAEVETINVDGHLPITIKRWGLLIVTFTTSVTMY